MNNEFIMQMRPFFGDDERTALKNYDFEDGFLTEFKETKKFEDELARILNVPVTTAVNNGTIALTIAALAVGVGVADEVIVPNFTMIASPNAIRMIGAKPVFCDVELSTWCLDRESIFQKITNRTKAVILVSANGRYPSYDVDKLRLDLNSLGIQLIEDAAQALGSYYQDGSAIGTKGNIATLSFSAPKIISTGQGGLIFSKDAEIIAKASRIKDFGRDAGGSDFHPNFGINSKFTDLQAVVGLAQLKKLEARSIRRKEQNQYYIKLLSDINSVTVPVHNYINTTPWFMEILIENRNELADYLKTRNIGNRSVYPEINKQPIYHNKETHSVSNYISDSGLWLPSHMGVTNNHIKYICDTIKDFIKKNNT
jgi:perosamine synthetase